MARRSWIYVNTTTDLDSLRLQMGDWVTEIQLEENNND